MTALLYLIQIYRVVDRFKGSGFKVQGSGFKVQGLGRREYPRKPLPLEGAAERSEAGLASFFGRRSGATVKRTLVQHAPLGKATDTREMLLKPAAPLFFDAACLNPEPINL